MGNIYSYLRDTRYENLKLIIDVIYFYEKNFWVWIGKTSFNIFPLSASN
jgi:hypothetical protein